MDGRELKLGSEGSVSSVKGSASRARSEPRPDGVAHHLSGLIRVNPTKKNQNIMRREVCAVRAINRQGAKGTCGHRARRGRAIPLAYGRFRSFPYTFLKNYFQPWMSTNGHGSIQMGNDSRKGRSGRKGYLCTGLMLDGQSAFAAQSIRGRG